MFQSVEPCLPKSAFELEPFPEPVLSELELVNEEVVEPLVDSAFMAAEEETNQEAPKPMASPPSLDSIASPFLKAEEVESENLAEAEKTEAPAPVLEIVEEDVAEAVDIFEPKQEEPPVAYFEAVEEEVEVCEKPEPAQEPVREVVEAEVLIEKIPENELPAKSCNPFDAASAPQLVEAVAPVAAPAKSYFDPPAQRVETASQASPAATSWEPPAPSNSKKKNSRFGAFFKQ